MRRRRIAGLALVLAGGVVASAVAVDRSVDEAELREAKTRTWFAIYARGDADALDGFLLDGFEVIGADGSVSPKAAEVAWLRANRWNATGFRYVVTNVRFVGDDVAIVRGEGGAPRSNAAGPCAMRYVSSNLFRKVDGRWRPALSHISGQRCDAAAPAPASR